MKTCLNRLLGRCKTICTRDYNIKHHPNNLDCPDYIEADVCRFKIYDMKELRKLEGKLG